MKYLILLLLSALSVYAQNIQEVVIEDRINSQSPKLSDAKQIRLLEQKAQELVQYQLDAYNRRDLDGYLSVYSFDVEVYQFPDSLLYKGLDNMKKVYENFFNSNKVINCRLMNRIVNKKFVIDHERITGHETKGTFEAVAIYEIGGNKIKKIWFVPKD